MDLKLNAQNYTWSPSHFLYIEKVGPLAEVAPLAWQEFHAILPTLKKSLDIKCFVSLYKVKPQSLYRAGVILKEKPDVINNGLRYDYFEGGNYLKYTLTGTLDEVPHACANVLEQVQEEKIPLARNYFIEHYVTNPATTDAKANITEFWVPVE